jgi:hypothetical protein
MSTPAVTFTPEQKQWLMDSVDKLSTLNAEFIERLEGSSDLDDLVALDVEHAIRDTWEVIRLYVDKELPLTTEATA